MLKNIHEIYQGTAIKMIFKSITNTKYFKKISII